MGVRRQARESALQALFMCDFLNEWSDAAVEFCFDHFSVPKAAKPYAVELCSGVIKNKVTIDAELTCASENWSLSRMGRVDRSILRVATYEIVLLPEIPPNVAINEAIEVAKRFGAEESPQFVNGVLDRVAATFRAQHPVTEQVERLKVEVIPMEKELEGELDIPLPALGADADDLEYKSGE